MIFFTFSALFAQEKINMESYRAVVIDTMTENPLPYAICRLSDTKNKSANEIKVVTDSMGNLSIGRLISTEYQLTVSYLGYEEKTLRVCPLENNEITEVIALHPLTNQLEAVEINKQPKLLEFSPEKLTVNVARSALAKGGTAFEVLTRTPGVIEQGSILQFRGRSVNVYINGRPSNFRSAELKQFLENLPSSSISKIEVITSPSSKYDAQGGSIVNIVTTKNASLGLSGIAGLGYSKGDVNNYNGNLQLNYKNEKIAAFGSFDHLNTEQYYRLHSSRSVNKQLSQHEYDDRVIKKRSNLLQLGLDYNINKAHTLSMLLRGNYNRTLYNSKDQVSNLSSIQIDSTSNVISNGKNMLKNPSVNVFYKWLVDTSGKELSLNLDYFRYRRDQSDFFETDYLNAQDLLTGNDLLRNISPGKNEVKSASIDYKSPLKSGKLEAGLKSVSTVTDNNMLWEYYEGASWQNDIKRSNHFIYTERVQAAYINGTTQLGKMGMQLGLRLEHTYTKGELLTDGSANTNDYLNIFPSVSFNYMPDGQTQWALAYRRKIDRYDFSVVNPFIYYRNPFSYTQGNPYIRPTYYDNFELSYFSGQIFGAVSYSNYRDVLADIFREDLSTNAVITTYDNLAKAHQLDANISWSKSFRQKLSTTTTVGGLYAQYDSDDEQFNNAGYTLYLSSTNSLQLTKGLSGEVYVSYFSPFSYGVYEMAHRFKTDIGLSQSLFKDEAQLAIGITDLFNTMKNQYQVNSYGISLNSRVKPESQFFKVTFTYRFGNKKVKSMSAKKTGIENEQKRMIK